MPSGQTRKFTSLKAPNWCTAIIKNVDTDEFILVREFRHGVNEWVYEFPSGTVEEGEDIETAALREVEEETGYHNGRIVKKLFTGNPNPAFMCNTMNGYYVEVHGQHEKQNLDTSEFIQVVAVKNPADYLTDKSSIANQLLWAKYLLMSR